jgi:hypothetical protein
MEKPKLRRDGTYDLPVTEEHVGAGLLESVSSGMYPRVYDILREYIQNAIDAHAKDVYVTVSKQEITIEDNGDGMDVLGLDEARKLGVSGKPGTGKVGFRGIGVYSSFSMCESVEITSKQGTSRTANVLRFAHAKIRAETSASSSGTRHAPALIDALQRHTEIRPAKVLPERRSKGKSFTLVRLIRPDARLWSRLDEQHEVERYLMSSVPLDFPVTGFPYADEIREAIADWVKPPLNLIRVHYRFSNGASRVYTQPPVADVLPPIGRVLKGKSKTPVAFLWTSINREREQLKAVNARGLQLRFRGFGIGDRTLPKGFGWTRGHGTLYEWLTGEVYVLDQTLTPTVDRATFAESDRRDVLIDALKGEFAKIEKLVDDRRDGLVRITAGCTGLTAAGDPKEFQKAVKNLLKGLKQLEKVYPEFIVMDPDFQRSDLLDLRTREALENAGLLEEIEDSFVIDLSGLEWKEPTKSSGGASSGGSGGGTTKDKDAGGGGSGGGGGGGTGGGSGGGGGTGTASGGGGSGTKGSDDGSGGGNPASDDSLPSIVNTLMDAGPDWPEDAEEVFEELEAAVRSSLSEPEYRKVKRAVADRLSPVGVTED